MTYAENFIHRKRSRTSVKSSREPDIYSYVMERQRWRQIQGQAGECMGYEWALCKSLLSGRKPEGDMATAYQAKGGRSLGRLGKQRKAESNNWARWQILSWYTELEYCYAMILIYLQKRWKVLIYKYLVKILQ